VLDNELEFEDLKVLDLCAGTGNISFEFVSRGANHVLSIDSHPRCIQYLKSNVVQLGIEEKMQVYKSDCVIYCKNSKETFDVIFADPPFNLNFHEELVTMIFEKGLLNEDGLLVIEHGRQTNLEHHPNFEKSRTFGNVHFSFFVNVQP
jgi:16S rRNA (guanine(966)-N(2))-methyltransferase RsmD